MGLTYDNPGPGQRRRPSLIVELLETRVRGRWQWRFRFRRSGRILAHSEAYLRRRDAVRALTNLLESVSAGRWRWIERSRDR